MKIVYDIYEHVKGIGMTNDLCLSDYEDGFIFDNIHDAERCCEYMNAIFPNRNYYYWKRKEDDNYII